MRRFSGTRHSPRRCKKSRWSSSNNVDAAEFYRQASTWYAANSADVRTVTARSVISRAYYAAFLVARDKAGITRRMDPHKATIEWFRNRGGNDAVIANKLDNLRILRGQADYDLTPDCVRRDAGSALKRSLDLLQSLRPGFTP